MKKILILTLFALGFFEGSAQSWTTVNGRQRFVSGLGIPVRDTSTATAADSAQIVIRPQDGKVYYRYKSGWRVVGITNISWDSVTNRPTNFSTNYALSNDIQDSIQRRVVVTDNAVNRIVTGTATINQLKAQSKLNFYPDSGIMMISAEPSTGYGAEIDFDNTSVNGTQWGLYGGSSSLNGMVLYRYLPTQVELAYWDIDRYALRSDVKMAWSSTLLAFQTPDIALSREGAGLLQVNNGTTNNYADLKLRNLTLTGTATGTSMTMTNDITANTFIKATGTSSQIMLADGSVLDKTNLYTGEATFDTTGRVLTLPKVGGGSTSVVIPRGTSSGAEGITALSSSRSGNLLTIAGDNGSTTTISIRDADSASLVRFTDTASIVSGYTRIQRFTDSLAAVQARIQTKQPLGDYLTRVDSLSGGYTTWLRTKKVADSLGAIIATKGTGTVTSVAASAGTGISVSGSPITGSGTLTITNTAPDQTVTLTAGTGISVTGTYPNFTINNTSTANGTVTSVGLSAPTGFSVSGSPVTSTGTLALGFAAGYSLPTDASQTNWNTAFNKRLSSASFSASQLTLTLADATTVTTSVPTFNQNTTGTAGSLSAVLSSSLGGAGSVNGILKANGSGLVSAAIAGTDYVAPSALSGYLPLSGGTLTGALNGTTISTSGGITTSNYFNLTTPTTSFGAGTTSATWAEINTGTAFNVRISGGDRLRVSSTEVVSTVPISGTSAAFSGDILVGSSFTSSQKLKVGYGASSGYFHMYAQSSNLYFGQDGSGAAIISDRDAPMYFYVKDAEAMRISASKNLLIKTTTESPNNEALQVAGSGLFSGDLYVSNSASSQVFIKGNSSSTDFGRIWFGSGNFVAGKTAITGMYSDGLYKITIQPTTGNFSNVFEINGSTGAATFSSSVTATAFFESSDARLKNVISRDGDVAYFKWKDGSDNKTHIGYIAQEVQKKNPDQVKADEKGMLSVNYIEVLVQKVRALEIEVENLKKSK